MVSFSIDKPGSGLRARRWLSLALGASLAVGGALSAWAETVTLSPVEMRDAAVLSLETGNAEQARRLTDALLGRDSADVEAMVLNSRALRDLGQYDAALEQARAAYRLAETDPEIYAAALARAQALSSLGARTRAQLWLRMASEHAPNEEARARAIRDFQYVRSRNRWNTRLSFSLAPTSNVNDGSTHDTISYGGLQGVVLDGAARALSGLSYSGRVTTRYRFSEGKHHQTEVGLHLFHESYILSDEAQEIAPDAEGDDFAYSSVAIGLRHKWRPGDWRTPLEFSLLYGRGWYGGEDYSRYTRSSVGRPFILSKSTLLRIEAGGEHFYRVIDDATQRSYHAGATLLHEFENGGGLRLSFGLRDSHSDLGSLDYTRKLAGIAYTLPKPVAKARATLEFDYEQKLYDAFPTLDTVGPFIVLRDTERLDHRRALGLSLFFDQVDYYGFSPTVTLRHAETQSTDDRYDTVDTGVHFGFRSNF
ncbi:surface lipoprotein assembly modifier [Tropicimonas sp. TH_r6]|uniref:surface lipoprotein assembly modifier n=1 Tax=Tropicimonas sp. TH_r6 TaxID=3082085 RepID=UPI00295539D8|nr:surface lipoprotein assembly modifier [Tropicimonas sp. TH_r6]MDV7141919.1 surface lipoprotein assembly modifier [Tropicimonas sp. TH_r6]